MLIPYPLAPFSKHFLASKKVNGRHFFLSKRYAKLFLCKNVVDQTSERRIAGKKMLNFIPHLMRPKSGLVSSRLRIHEGFPYVSSSDNVYRPAWIPWFLVFFIMLYIQN